MNAAGFFAVMRSRGALRQSQVDGANHILAACEKANWGIGWTAYGLATAYHETAFTLQPVREAFNLSEAWRKANLRYYPWYGRGYVQLTWEKNYLWADQRLGLDGRLHSNPDLALDPDIAADIMVHGMSEGAFTGKKLADYFPQHGCPISRDQYVAARRIINGTDRAANIAAYAAWFEQALTAGGWA